MPDNDPVTAVPHANVADPCMTVAELNDFFAAAFPDGRPYVVEAVGPHTTTMHLPADHVMIRPGGTVSGPTLMGLADAAAYAVILAHLGPVALAVTSNLNITFLHKPAPTGVRAETEILKLGRKLAVVDVRLFGDDRPDLVAQATVTYAIPSSEWNRTP